MKMKKRKGYNVGQVEAQVKIHEEFIERVIEEKSRVEMKPVVYGKRYVGFDPRCLSNIKEDTMEIPTSFTGKLAIIDGHYILEIGCEVRVCDTKDDLKKVLSELIDQNIGVLEDHEAKNIEAMKARGAIEKHGEDS